MNKIDLNGAWEFKAVDKYRRLPKEISGITEWMSGAVPGTVHTDLLTNGKIPDPFYRMNEEDVQWVDSQQWVYRREFEVDEKFLKEKSIELVAEGLDTYSSIRINNRRLGTTADMFVEHRFNAKRFLRKGTNHIEILFDSPVLRSKAIEKKHGVLAAGHEPHRIYVRKAQYSFGWDWGPRLATSGIWRGISLEAHSQGALRYPFVKVISLTKNEAVVELSIDVSLFTTASLQLRTEICDEKVIVTDRRRAKKGKMKFRLRIKKPQIWWPNGYGGQPMYRASITLTSRDAEVERLEVPFALRTVSLCGDEISSFPFSRGAGP